MEQKYWTDLVSELLTLRSDPSPTTGIDAPDRYSGSPLRYRDLANVQFQASRNVIRPARRGVSPSQSPHFDVAAHLNVMQIYPYYSKKTRFTFNLKQRGLQ